MATFTARFRGVCVACDGRIEKGAEIVGTGDGYVHAECDGSAREPALRALCPRCHVEVPLSGLCDYCD